ncbi:MAG TPA: ATP-grasp domain-containing protein, partial [Pirellulaceae bacterium]|nr:ATP-grasp domain-containing protein [Pirellulaceae bacterium]
KTMLSLLATDFAALPGVTVTLFQDYRVRHKVELPDVETIVVERPIDLFRKCEELAPQVDYGLIIAPELEGNLEDWATKWTLLEGKLLSPDPGFIQLASSKQRTAERLAEAGVPVPYGVPLGWPDKLPEEFPYPGVLKRDDGAGSEGVIYVEEPRDGKAKRRIAAADWRLEKYCPGLPASVAVLAGPSGHVLLPACLQWLSDDKKFRYQGGMTPLASELNARAQHLAELVVAAMPTTSGYFGIDLVLGAAADGSADVVIEVNPRLTTSYVGLRAIARQNLAQAMLDMAEGRSCDLTFDNRRVQFSLDGQVVELS